MSAFYSLPASHNVKNFNKHAAVDLIRFTGRRLSRTDIAEQLGLTRAGVTIIINDLIENGIILETGSRSTSSGRPPVLLEVNPKQGFVAAVDLGAAHLSVALGDLAAQIIDETEQPFCIADGPKKCLAEVDCAIKAILSRHRLDFPDLSAVGVSVPGPVVTEMGMVMSPPIMPGWDRFPIRATLEKLWGVPVVLNNDADLGALGEWVFGAGRGEKNIVFIKVGTGIGAGIIINQQIYMGTTGSAGEIGHVTIDEHGPFCACGNHGCLEAIASGHAIEIQAQELVHSGKKTLLADPNLKVITVRDVAEAARRGDLASQEILHRAGTFIGIEIANLINLLNPGVVIIGGGVAEVGDLLTAPIRKMVRERSLRVSEYAVKITTAMLGRRSTLIGTMVQATNIAIHNSIDGKAPVFKRLEPANEPATPDQPRQEVMITPENSKIFHEITS